MKMSVMLFPFHKELSDGKLSARTLMAEMKAVGVTALEPMLSWVDTAPQKWAELRQAAADAGIRYACFDVGVNFVGESEADRVKALDIVKRGVALCQEIGCPIALLPGSKPAKNMSDDEGRKIYSDGLAKSVDLTRGSGVTLTIEDFGVYPTFACSAKHCLEVLDGAQRPELKFTFDNGNFLLADDQPTECFRLTASRVAHVHIKDFALKSPEENVGIKSRAGKRYVGCAIGAGAAEVRDCLALIKRSGYNGWLSIEVSISPPVQAAIQGAKFIAEAWKNV